MEIYPTTVPFLSPRDSSTSIFGNASLRNLTQPQPKLQERTKVNPSEVPYNNLSARCALDTFTYGLLPDLAFIKDTSIRFFYSPSCQFKCNLVLANNSIALAFLRNRIIAENEIEKEESGEAKNLMLSS